MSRREVKVRVEAWSYEGRRVYPPRRLGRAAHRATKKARLRLAAS